MRMQHIAQILGHYSLYSRPRTPTLYQTVMSTRASEILATVPHRFEQALSSGDLFFFPSTLHTHQELGVFVREVTCHQSK